MDNIYFSEGDLVIRTSVEEDIEEISEIAKKSSKEIGFVMKIVLKDSCKTQTLLTALYKNNIVGFCNFNIRNKDNVCVIYEICVHKDFRGLGIAKKMIEILPKPILLKCPIDNESNNFYKKIGFKKIDIEEGKKRPLNVWRFNK